MCGQICVCFFVLLNRYWGIVMYGFWASSWASQGRHTPDLSDTWVSSWLGPGLLILILLSDYLRCNLALILRLAIYAQIRIHIHVRMCINAYIYIYLHTCTYIYMYMSAHIHTYTYIHTRIQNVHMNARKARLKRRRGSDCAGDQLDAKKLCPSPCPLQSWEGYPSWLAAQLPVTRNDR